MRWDMLHSWEDYGDPSLEIKQKQTSIQLTKNSFKTSLEITF